MLTAADAPILAAVLGPQTTVLDAEQIIAARPPGGYNAISDFFAQRELQAAPGATALGTRLATTSKYVLARAEIVYGTTVIEMTMTIAVSDNGEAMVIARRFGAEE